MWIFLGAPVKKDVTYFKNLVILNTDILESAAKTWDEINNSLQDVSEESKSPKCSTILWTSFVDKNQ